MGYHSATITLKDTRNPDRLTYEVGTVYHKGATPHVSVAYTTVSEDHKILRWSSNDAVIPRDIVQELEWPHRVEMDEARDIETAASIEQYKAARSNISDEQLAEEAFERRAAFGPGEEIVNILTGERYVS